MNFIVATLMAAIFGLSQLVCACPAGASGDAVSSTEIAVHTHESHALKDQTPCDGDSEHCDMQSLAIAKSATSLKTSPLADLVPLDTLFVTAVNWPAGQIRAPPIASLPDRQRRLRALSPVQLKVRFLN